MLEFFRDDLNERKIQYKVLTESLALKNKEAALFAERLLDLQEMSMITQLLSKQNQTALADVLNSTVTEGLQSVFGPSFEFKLVIDTSAGAVQAHPKLLRDGFVYSPKSSEGGGVLQMVSLALRVSLLSLLKEAPPIVILDEIFKDIGKVNLADACKMVRVLSDSMNIQFILTTHAREIVNVADTIHYIHLDEEKTSQAQLVSKDEAFDIFDKMMSSSIEEE
jgi:hypothetical protein